ncbi:cytochrome c peroxidase [Denitratisoma sp. agr-D3]
MKKAHRYAVLAGAILITWLVDAPSAWADATCLRETGWDKSCVVALYAAPSRQWPRPAVDNGIAWRELSSLPTGPSLSKQRVALGSRLFNDPRLSRSNTIACASCHQVDKGYTNGQAVAVGHDEAKGSRNVPGLWNLHGARALFWDGRADSLETQALGPIANPVEMAMSLEKLAAKLAGIAEYRRDFALAFGPGPISLDRISRALADYERTLRSPFTRFDRFLAGERAALSEDETLGLHLFRTKARCLNCHYGSRMTDDGFHNLGLTYFGRKYEDFGRYEVTGRKEDVGRFKTPGLRGVGSTGPWMHNGLFPQLAGILNMYNAGMPSQVPNDAAQAANPLFPVKSSLLKPLALNREELDALLAFLLTL